MANGNNQQQPEGHTFTYDPRYPIPKPSDQPPDQAADGSVTSNVPPLIDTQLTSTGGVQNQLPDTSGRFAPIERAAGKAGVPQAGPHPEGTIVITPLPGQDGQQAQPQQPAQPQGWQPSPAATAVAQQQAEQYKAESQKGPQVWSSTPQLPPEGQTLEQQPHPLDAIQAQNTADNNQVAQAVDEYKTMTQVQQAYAAGQINKSVALAAQNQIQQTYNNAIPAQQKAMEQAEADAAKPDVPPPQKALPGQPTNIFGQPVTSNPAYEFFSSVLTGGITVGGKPLVLNPMPVQDAQFYLDENRKALGLSDQDYAQKTALLNQAQELTERMQAGAGFTPEALQRNNEIQKQVLGLINQAVPQFLEMRQQQAIGELQKGGQNIIDTKQPGLLAGLGFPEKNRPENAPDAPYVPILKKNFSQRSASLDYALQNHIDETNRVTPSLNEQDHIDQETRNRGLTVYSPQQMAQAHMAPRASAIQGGRELASQVAEQAAMSFLPMPWEGAVGKYIWPGIARPLAKGFSVTGKGLERTGQILQGRGWHMIKRPAIGTIVGLAEHMVRKGDEGDFFKSLQELLRGDPKDIIDYFKGSALEMGVGALTNLIGTGVRLKGKTFRYIASGIRSSSPEIKMAINPSTQRLLTPQEQRAVRMAGVKWGEGRLFTPGQAINAEEPYRAAAAKGPSGGAVRKVIEAPLGAGRQFIGRTTESFAKAAINGAILSLPDLQDGDVGRFLQDVREFGYWGAVLRAPIDVRDSFRGTLFDTANSYKGEVPNLIKPFPQKKYGPSYQYKTGPQAGRIVDLDRATQHGMDQLDASRQGTFTRLQDLMTDYGSAHMLPDGRYEDIARDQGADPNSRGFTMPDPLNPGKTVSFFRASAFDTTALHEMLGHVNYHLLGTRNQAGFNRLISQVVDMDGLATKYANLANPRAGTVTMSMLPTDAEVTPGTTSYDPAKEAWSQAHGNLTKERLFEEAGAEILASLWGGKTADQWTQKPSLLRQFRSHIADLSEKWGLGGPTQDVNGPLGVQKSMALAKFLDVYLRDFATGQIPPTGATKDYFAGASHIPLRPGASNAPPTNRVAQVGRGVALVKRAIDQQQAQERQAQAPEAPGQRIGGGTTPANQGPELPFQSPGQAQARVGGVKVPAAPDLNLGPEKIGEAGEGPGPTNVGRPPTIRPGPQQPAQPKASPQPSATPKQTTAPEAPSGPKVSDEFVNQLPKNDEGLARAQIVLRLEEQTGEKDIKLNDKRVDAVWKQAVTAGATDQESKLPVKGSTREPVPPMAQPKNAPNTSRTTRATWFGRNPDGSVDTTDEKTMSYYNAHHGAWGADLLDRNLIGVAKSPGWLRANGIDPKKSPSSQGYKVRVTAPNGKSEIADIVDLGPRNTVDMTYGLGKKLGLNDNSQLKVELLKDGKTVAVNDEPQGGGGGGDGGGGKDTGDESKAGLVPVGMAPVNFNVPQQGPTEYGAEVPPVPPQRMPGGGGEVETGYSGVPASEVHTGGISAYHGGEGASPAMQMAEYTGGFGGGFGYGGGMQGVITPGMGGAPEAPGGFRMAYMPGLGRGGGRIGGIEPEEEEGGPAAESTLGQPNVRGFEQLHPLLNSGKLKEAQKLHASLLSPDDTRVKKQADNFFKGEHFVAGDPVHAAALASVPQNEKVALAAGQTAIENKRPMHMSYVSAPPGPGRDSPITRASREVNYDESSPQARLLGQTNGRLAGHSIIPTAVGVSLGKKKGEPNSGYIQGISTSAAAHNHHQINQALAEMGEESPYPELGSPKFHGDMRGYIRNLLAGHSGTGEHPQVSTEEFPSHPEEGYTPHKLTRREADFLNAVINNQAARHSEAYRRLAHEGGTLLSEEGEVNPMRQRIDQEHIHDPAINHAAGERWSKNVLEPTVRTFKAGLIHAVHDSPEHIPQEIRPSLPGYHELTKALGEELTSEKGRPDVPMSVAFMPGRGKEKRPAPLSPEEHAELTGNIRKQFLSGKLKQADYIDRLADVPEPGEAIRPAYMPMAGKKARGFAQAEKEGRTFETPLPGGGKRFEIDDRDIQFKPARKYSSHRNALEERYVNDKRGAGIMPLSDAIDHPELFENYPHLRNTKISTDPTIPNYGHYEQPWVHEPTGDMRGDHIVLKDPTDKETLAHEIQHAVQYHEDYAGKGANPEDIEDKLWRDSGVKAELRKQWDAAYPDREPDKMTREEWNANIDQMQDWRRKRMKEMAYSIYQMEPGEVEARVAGQRAMRTQPEEGFRERTPKEDVLAEMREAEQRGRRSQTMNPVYGEFSPEFQTGTKPRSIAYMAGAGKGKKPPPEIAPEIFEKLGPRPEDPDQGDLYDKVALRLHTQKKDAIPLEPDRKANGDFKYKKVGEKKTPLYKTVDYNLANAPMLQKMGKALGTVINPRTGKPGYAKAPEGTVDRMDELDPENRLKPYLTPTDRLRVSHLDKISATSAIAKKLVEYFHTVKNLPEIMAAEKWYDETEELLKQHFGPHADLVANLLGATSAGTNVKVNYKMAMEAYHQFLRGAYDKHIEMYRKADKIRSQGEGALMQHIIDEGIHTKLGEAAPTKDTEAMDQYIAHHGITPYQSNGKLFGHNTAAVLKVLSHTWEREAGGPKTPNFAANMSGKSLQATIDMWAARHVQRILSEGYTDKPWRIQPAAETGVNDTDFGLSQIAFRKAAEQLGYSPKSLQAILWFAEQKHWQNQGWEDEVDPNDRDYRPSLREYQRPEDISEEHVGRAEQVRQRAVAQEAEMPRRYQEGGPVTADDGSDGQDVDDQMRTWFPTKEDLQPKPGQAHDPLMPTKEEILAQPVPKAPPLNATQYFTQNIVPQAERLATATQTATSVVDMIRKVVEGGEMSPIGAIALLGQLPVEIHQRTGLLGPDLPEQFHGPQGTEGGAAYGDPNPLMQSSRQVAAQKRKAADAPRPPGPMPQPMLPSDSGAPD